MVLVFESLILPELVIRKNWEKCFANDFQNNFLRNCGAGATGFSSKFCIMILLFPSICMCPYTLLCFYTFHFLPLNKSFTSVFYPSNIHFSSFPCTFLYCFCLHTLNAYRNQRALEKVFILLYFFFFFFLVKFIVQVTSRNQK